MAYDITIGGADANSYVDDTEIATYLGERLHDSALGDLSDADTEALAKWVTKLLNLLNWKGDSVNTTQALRWPRTGTYDLEGNAIATTVIPDFLKNAQIEWMLATAGTDLTLSDEVGLESLAIGPINLKFKGSDRKPVVPKNAMLFIAPHIRGSGLRRVVR